MTFPVKLILAAAAAAALAGPASAQIFTFSTTMTGAAEAPPVASNAGGSAVVTFNSQASTVTVQEYFFNLVGGLTDNHIHCCTTTPLTGTVGVAVGFTGLPLGVTSGSYFNTFTLTNTAYTNLLNGALSGKAYVNVHTSFSPSGEIRGFLGLVSVVPEPATYALMLGGLAAVGFLARRRKVD